MAITLDENTVGHWFLDVAGGDILIHLAKIGDGYKITHRFRENDPDDPENDPFTLKDKKTWAGATSPPGTTRDEAIAMCRRMMEIQKEVFGTGRPIYEVINDKGFADFWERFLKQPYVQKREHPSQ